MIRPEGWMVETVRKKYGVTDHYTEGHTMKAGEAILIPIKDLESLITTSLIESYESLKKEVNGHSLAHPLYASLDREEAVNTLRKLVFHIIDQRIAELKGKDQ